MIRINDLARDEIRQLLGTRGQPAYRARQVCEWLYRKRAVSFREMTNLPLELRQDLARDFAILRLRKRQEIVSPEDEATKYVLELDDGMQIESVLLPHPRGATLCLSTQVGCAFKCRFCATGKMGLKRNLSAGEIVDQVCFIEAHLGNDADTAAVSDTARPFSNLVFMGMGEPLANYENLIKAIGILIEEVGIGSRRITVSTCGIPERIIQLAEVPYDIRLAISINSPSDEARKKLMPVAGRTPLSKVISAARYYYARKRKMLTFEYVLIAEANDSMRDAHALAGLIREVPAKVNLIALNPFPGCRYKRPEPDKVRRFQAILRSRGKKVTLRKSLGCDILAGCGQLGAAAKATRSR